MVDLIKLSYDNQAIETIRKIQKETRQDLVLNAEVYPTTVPGIHSLGVSMELIEEYAVFRPAADVERLQTRFPLRFNSKFFETLSITDFIRERPSQEEPVGALLDTLEDALEARRNYLRMMTNFAYMEVGFLFRNPHYGNKNYFFHSDAVLGNALISNTGIVSDESQPIFVTDEPYLKKQMLQTTLALGRVEKLKKKQSREQG